jgi:hypothetical protein
MKDLININNLPTTHILSGYKSGKIRFITKCRAGYMICTEARDFDNTNLLNNPDLFLGMFKKGALQTIEFQPEGISGYLTIFARSGKKIKLIDETILVNLTVGTINSYWVNTDLYDQRQYQAVNAATWASYAYRMNEPKFETIRVS